MDLFRRLFSQSESNSQEAVSQESSQAVEKTAAPVSQNDMISKESVEVEAVIADGATRPLPLETVISAKNEHLTFGQSTDVGMVRTNNQDSALSLFFTSRSAEERPDFGLFIVADGMGGHHDGEKASAMVARIVATQVTNNIYLPLLAGDSNADRPSITETLISAVQKANADVMSKVPEGGTTLSAATIIGDLAYIVHVGDSRVYLITKDGPEQITRDHSLVQRLIELDQLTDEEAQDHPQRNVLYRALGQSEQLEVDAITRRLPPNSRLLLCSDGLWNQVAEKEIGEITMSHDNPQQACDKLVALANTRGGTDNITAILLQIPTS
jgi:protein phosphatase